MTRWVLGVAGVYYGVAGLVLGDYNMAALGGLMILLSARAEFRK